MLHHIHAVSLTHHSLGHNDDYPDSSSKSIQMDENIMTLTFYWNVPHWVLLIMRPSRFLCTTD